jgi:hypothetical protein
VNHEQEPNPVTRHYTEIHRDFATQGLEMIVASPEDSNLYASETGNHSLLDELRVNYGQLPPEYLRYRDFSTDSVIGKGRIEVGSEGRTLRVNHIRGSDKHQDETMEHIRELAHTQGMDEVIFEEEDNAAEWYSREQMGKPVVRADVEQVPDTEIDPRFYNPRVDSGVVTSLQYSTDENGKTMGVLHAVQAHAKVHNTATAATGLDARGFAPRLEHRIFTEDGRPLRVGIRYVVDDANHMFKLDLTAPSGVDIVDKIAVSQTVSDALYSELGLDESYKPFFTFSDSRSSEEIDPARITAEVN